MNRGIRYSTADWILFLNSNDILKNTYSIFNCLKYVSKSYDIIHFNCHVRDENIVNVPVRKLPCDPGHLKYWPCIQHQSVIVKSSLLKSLSGFNTSYNILGDYDFFIKCFNNSKNNTDYQRIVFSWSGL